MDDVERGRAIIQRWFSAALAVADPRQAVRAALAFDSDSLQVSDHNAPIPVQGKLIVLATGKAACGMARGARDVLGDRIDAGVIMTKYGHVSDVVEGFEMFEAGHPVPDDSSLRATRHILTLVDGLSPDDVVLALISGGGSALLESPRPGITLDDMRAVTTRLMHAGAGIKDLNAVRKALSDVKGGGLRRRIGLARCVTLMLSDVLGNDPSVIASGPTVIPDASQLDSLAIVRRYGIEADIPGAVVNALQAGVTSGTLDTSEDVVEVIADNALFVREVAGQAKADALRVHVDTSPWEGEASELATEMVRTIDQLEDDVDVFIRGGEATVEVSGDGIGGRNTEMALRAALALESEDRWLVASLASDGDDGNSGATGAIADGDTVRRAREAGIDPVAALQRNDSATVFRQAGGLVATGPTGTNVNDVYIAVHRDALR